MSSSGKVKKGENKVRGKVKFKVFTKKMAGCGEVEDVLDIEVNDGGGTEEVCGIGVCVPEKVERVEDIPEDGCFMFVVVVSWTGSVIRWVIERVGNIVLLMVGL